MQYEKKKETYKYHNTISCLTFAPQYLIEGRGNFAWNLSSRR